MAFFILPMRCGPATLSLLLYGLPPWPLTTGTTRLISALQEEIRTVYETVQSCLSHSKTKQRREAQNSRLRSDNSFGVRLCADDLLGWHNLYVRFFEDFLEIIIGRAATPEPANDKKGGLHAIEQINSVAVGILSTRHALDRLSFDFPDETY